jgi:hypothetical protein
MVREVVQGNPGRAEIGGVFRTEVAWNITAKRQSQFGRVLHFGDLYRGLTAPAGWFFRLDPQDAGQGDRQDQADTVQEVF